MSNDPTAAHGYSMDAANSGTLQASVVEQYAAGAARSQDGAVVCIAESALAIMQVRGFVSLVRYSHVWCSHMEGYVTHSL